MKLNQMSMTLACLVLLAVFASGCDKATDPRGIRAAVTGTVTLDGKPLSGARIVFVTEGESGAIRATALIDQGAFSLGVEDGPLPGKARVEIVPKLKELSEYEMARGSDPNDVATAREVEIPIRYNQNSDLTAEITQEGDNNLSFDLFSQSKQTHQ